MIVRRRTTKFLLIVEKRAYTFHCLPDFVDLLDVVTAKIVKMVDLPGVWAVYSWPVAGGTLSDSWVDHVSVCEGLHSAAETGYDLEGIVALLNASKTVMTLTDDLAHVDHQVTRTKTKGDRFHSK